MCIYVIILVGYALALDMTAKEYHATAMVQTAYVILYLVIIHRFIMRVV